MSVPLSQVHFPHPTPKSVVFQKQHLNQGAREPGTFKGVVLAGRGLGPTLLAGLDAGTG